MTLTALMANLGCNLMLCHIDDEWCARKLIPLLYQLLKMPVSDSTNHCQADQRPGDAVPGRPGGRRQLPPAPRLQHQGWRFYFIPVNLYIYYISLSNYLSFFRDLTFCFCTVAFYLGHYLVYHKVSFLIFFIASLSWKPFYIHSIATLHVYHIKDEAPDMVNRLLNTLLTTENFGERKVGGERVKERLRYMIKDQFIPKRLKMNSG